MRLRQLLVTWSILVLASQGLAQGCGGWNTSLFFPAAKPADVVKCIAKGADVNARGEYGMTPLHFAARFNDDPAIIAALVAAGAELEAELDEGLTPLHLAAGFNDNPAVIEALLDAKADRKAQDEDGNTPWDYAADRAELQGSDAYRRLRPKQGLLAMAIDKVKSFVLGLPSMVLKLPALVGSWFGIVGNGAEEMVAMVTNPTIFLETRLALSRFANNLNWSNIDPTKYLRAGMRGAVRSIEAAKGIWETIPAAIRAGGEGATRKYLEDKDWSHFKPYLPGWNDGPEDGIFEDSSLNRARGRAPMTEGEIRAAERALRGGAFRATLDQAVKIGGRVGLTSAAVGAMVAVLDYGLKYQKGEITAGDMFGKIGAEVAGLGVGGAALSGLVIAAALLSPPLIPVMSTVSVPLMVYGFAVMGGRLVNAGRGWYEAFRREAQLDPDWIREYHEHLKDRVLGLVPYLTP
ncbi:MAG: ankyrin repeat domain-containing protein [Truepera sp.]|nr:ankyrin repeat domain-containing protein [Truepera sp.]